MLGRYRFSISLRNSWEERLKLVRIIDALLLLDSSTYHIPSVADAKHAALVIKNTLK